MNATAIADIGSDTGYHNIEVKVRLAKRDAEMLRAIAARADMPRAVLARIMIVRALEKIQDEDSNPFANR